jgi:hypothetical protein
VQLRLELAEGGRVGARLLGLELRQVNLPPLLVVGDGEDLLVARADELAGRDLAAGQREVDGGAVEQTQLA